MHSHPATPTGIRRQLLASGRQLPITDNTFEKSRRDGGIRTRGLLLSNQQIAVARVARCRQKGHQPARMFARHRLMRPDDCLCWLPLRLPDLPWSRGAQRTPGAGSQQAGGRLDRNGVPAPRRRRSHPCSASRSARRPDRCRYSSGSTRRSFGRPADSFDRITSARSATATSTSPTSRRCALTVSSA